MSSKLTLCSSLIVTNGTDAGSGLINGVVGYTVLGIDYFEGESVSHHLGKPGFDWREWIPPLQKRVPELLGPWIADVRRRYEGSQFFCVGTSFL